MDNDTLTKSSLSSSLTQEQINNVRIALESLRPALSQMNGIQEQLAENCKTLLKQLQPTFDAIEQISPSISQLISPINEMMPAFRELSDIYKIDNQLVLSLKNYMSNINITWSPQVSNALKKLSETQLNLDEAFTCKPSDENVNMAAFFNEYQNLDTGYYEFDNDSLTHIEEAIGTFPNECKEVGDPGKTKVLKSFVRYLVNHLFDIICIIVMIYGIHLDHPGTNEYHSLSPEGDVQFLQEVEPVQEEENDLLRIFFEALNTLQNTIEDSPKDAQSKN